MNPIFSIGHSTHSAEKLGELLTMHSISAIADVRSSPYSRVNPQFNRETLRSFLKSKGIAYVFLGVELGARSEDRACYVNGKVQYSLLARTPTFQEGLERVHRGAETHRIALLCAEKDPLDCHRCILVSRQLLSRGLAVQHILSNGRVESHEDSIIRLMKVLRLTDRELFRTTEDLVEEAYRLREEEIAYVARADISSSRGAAR